MLEKKVEGLQVIDVTSTTTVYLLSLMPSSPPKRKCRFLFRLLAGNRKNDMQSENVFHSPCRCRVALAPFLLALSTLPPWKTFRRVSKHRRLRFRNRRVPRSFSFGHEAFRPDPLKQLLKDMLLLEATHFVLAQHCDARNGLDALGRSSLVHFVINETPIFGVLELRTDRIRGLAGDFAAQRDKKVLVRYVLPEGKVALKQRLDDKGLCGRATAPEDIGNQNLRRA